MRVEDSDLFQEVMSKGIESLKEENIFALQPLELKPIDKSYLCGCSNVNEILVKNWSNIKPDFT